MLFGKKTPVNNSTKNSLKQDLKIQTNSSNHELSGPVKMKVQVKGYGILE